MRSCCRFKVKHLLGALAVAAGVVALSYLLLPSLMLWIGDSYLAGGEQLTAKVYYDRVLHYFPRHGDAPKALGKAAQLAAGNLLMVSPLGIGGAYRDAGIISAEAREYYQNLAERFPRTWQGKAAVKELTLYEIRNLIHRGNIPGALGMLERYSTEQRAHRREEVTLETAKALRAYGYNHAAVELLEGFLENIEGRHNYPGLQELLGDVHGLTGNTEAALTCYCQVLEIYRERLRNDKEYYEHEQSIETHSYDEERESEIRRKMDLLSNGPVEPGTVTGRITLSGKPLAGVELVLQPLVEQGVFPHRSPEALSLTSGRNETFTFTNLWPGRYGLGFILDLDEVGAGVVLKGGHFPRSIIDIAKGDSRSWDFELVEAMKIVSPADGAVIDSDWIEFIWEPCAGLPTIPWSSVFTWKAAPAVDPWIDAFIQTKRS